MPAFKTVALLVVLFAVCCTLSVAAPQPREEEEEDQPAALPGYNLGEDVAGDEVLDRNRRAIDCNTAGHYGSSGFSSTYHTPSGCPCRDNIKKIYLRYTSGRIYQIQTIAVTADGNEVSYSAVGGAVGTVALIELAEGEQMIGISGYYSTTTIEQLTFFSITEEGNIRVHGPYGDLSINSADTFFSVIGRISGFFIRYDTSYIRGMTIYYEGEGLSQTRT